MPNSDKVLNSEAYPVATLDRLRGFHNHNGPKFRISLILHSASFCYPTLWILICKKSAGCPLMLLFLNSTSTRRSFVGFALEITVNP